DAIERAMSRYADAIRCAVRFGASNTYPYGGHPKGGEDSALRRMLRRAAGEPEKTQPASVRLSSAGSKRASVPASRPPQHPADDDKPADEPGDPQRSSPYESTDAPADAER